MQAAVVVGGGSIGLLLLMALAPLHRARRRRA